jgi:hypothetical protein
MENNDYKVLVVEVKGEKKSCTRFFLRNLFLALPKAYEMKQGSKPAVKHMNAFDGAETRKSSIGCSKEVSFIRCL